MLFTTQNTKIFRNYIIASTSVILLSISVSDLFNEPAKAVQQNRLDSYGRFISIGLVNKARKLASR